MDDLTGIEHRIGILLVANRGEIAVRIFETARALGITCVAVFSDPDRDARHVREADLAVHLPGATSAQTYLDIDAILAAAKRTGADAIHPGYGFLAENPEFAQAVIDAGLTWVGPAPDVIRAMALKVGAKEVAAAAGVPLVPGAELDAAEPPEVWAELAAQVGYPVMIKASAGGGGKGMRVVESPGLLLEAVAAAQREAGAAFGDSTVFLERYLPRARHVEVQVFGDSYGNVLHLFDRECSIQRRHQKIVEEAPSPGTTEATRSQMYAAALALAQRIGYVGAGTVEFLVSGDGDAQQFYFLEMNTRLQVEHRVTEQITGTDLVQWQLLVAQGKEFSVDQADLEIDGHAIEVRLYAEDPARDYLPSVGRIGVFQVPEEFGTVVDSGYAAGDTVSQYYDPLLAKIVAHGPDRESATRDLVVALRETVVSGVTTNRDMLIATLTSFPFFAGDTTTAFLEEHPGVLAPASDGARPPAAALVAAAFRHLDTMAGSGDWAADPFAGGLAPDPVPPRWRNVGGTPGFVGLAWGPRPQHAQVWVRFDAAGPDVWRISLSEGDGPYDGVADEVGSARVTIPASDDTAFGTPVPGDHVLVELAGLVTRLAAVVDPLGRIEVTGPDTDWLFHVVKPSDDRAVDTAELGPVAPVPGTVAAVSVSPGQAVAAGETLVVLEAMKMEHRITAEGEGVVAEVLVTVGQSVDAHQVLVTFADPHAAPEGPPEPVEGPSPVPEGPPELDEGLVEGPTERGSDD